MIEAHRQLAQERRRGTKEQRAEYKEMSNALHWQVKMVMSTDQPTAVPAMPTTVAVQAGPVAVDK